MSPLSGALIVVVALLIVLSAFFAQRAGTARAQFACSGWALYELKRGRPERSAAYLRAAHMAYFTGRCEPRLQLEIEVAR